MPMRVAGTALAGTPSPSRCVRVPSDLESTPRGELVQLVKQLQSERDGAFDQLELQPVDLGPPPDSFTSGDAEPGAADSSSSIDKPKTFWEKMTQLSYAPRDLYIIYSIKLCETCAYFAFSYVYAPFLSEEFGFSDVEAGMLYSGYGMLCSVFGLMAGPLIDRLSLRNALLLGTVPSFLGRLISSVTLESRTVTLCSVILLPLGATFGLPVFALCVRRFTHPENRAFAFTIFYSVLCSSAIVASLLITYIRAIFHDGWDVPLLGQHLSWLRVVVLVSSLFTFYTCAASCCIRNVQVQQDVPLERARLEPLPSDRPTWRQTVNMVYGSRPFWRLLAISLIVALGTRTTFRHMDATFPKYFMRVFGEDAPFEIFEAIEPVATVLLSFPLTYLLLRYRVSTFATLVGGTLLQSFCPLALLSSTYAANLVFVLVMAAGEAVWAPRLYEYSTMVAPYGYEGTFVAVTFVPQYVSAGAVGFESGLLLERYVPDPDLYPDAPLRPDLMWAIISIMAFITPLLLMLFKDCMFAEEPTLQQDAQSVACKAAAPSSPRRKGDGAYGLVFEAAAEDSEPPTI